jgi:hypothetical protein
MLLPLRSVSYISKKLGLYCTKYLSEKSKRALIENEIRFKNVILKPRKGMKDPCGAGFIRSQLGILPRSARQNDSFTKSSE